MSVMAESRIDPREDFLTPNYEILENPRTQAYEDLKAYVLGERMLWQYSCATAPVNQMDPYQHMLPLLSHAILDRPDWSDLGYPTRERMPPSYLYEHAMQVFTEICEYNGFSFDPVRIALNFTTASKAATSVIHTDHKFPHWIIVVYFTDFYGGHTWIDNRRGPDPAEDAVVTFDGINKHHHEPPVGLDDRRIIMMMSYKPKELEKE